jgi:predicted nucleotidyltransferase
MRSEHIQSLTLLSDIERTALHQLYHKLTDALALRDVILFGSKARGTFNPDSDLDVLAIIQEPKTWKTREQVSDLCLEVNLEYDTNITCSLESSIHWDDPEGDMWPSFRENVMEEGIRIEF